MDFPRQIGNWWLEEKLGSGFSGSIFRAVHIHTRQVAALKMQYVNHECPTNKYERGFFQGLQGGEGLPLLYSSGVEGIWDYLVIELLGPSLDMLFRKSGLASMDLRSVCSIAVQLIARLQFMHHRGILHRDIQLGNCVIGLGTKSTMIYMIDFGFSKRYIDPNTNRHLPDDRRPRDFIGNYWFSSVAVHCKGRVPSRRDDLEAAALMLIHLLTPKGLSWTRNGVPKNEAQHKRLKKEKRELGSRPEELCKGMPAEFEEFLRYSRRLKFTEQPDYERWIAEFRALADHEGFGPSDAFIWPPPPVPVNQHTPGPRRTPAKADSDEVEAILAGLAKLNFGERAVLGDRSNIDNAVQKAKSDAKKPAEVVIISDDSIDGKLPAGGRIPKAAQLNKLTVAITVATDNQEISEVVTDFVAFLQSNRSRMLTKEGFAFLDALHKQLADPSVFIVPLRTSRTRNPSQQQEATPDPPRLKLDVLANLRREVPGATANSALARMVADFGTVINKSSGRTVTKDGFAFLDGLAARLKTM
ncbi:kinase-like protein [Athelia psychrophila]|uniref:Kinase-like protein n=1 Tax=Athelia psychrophila TaxID=1759441 RepID=A0A166WAX0_9AGAM|nr:kinase-like protein [Fibularhizoctonia sp. CBS 109695]